jgi:DNA-binding IscR family transcriptional regulator
LGGGFQFASDPARVTVLEVINAVDPLERIHTCPLGLKAHGKNLCPLHCGMNEVAEQMEATFAQSKLADLLNTDSASVPSDQVVAYRPASPAQT